MDLQQMQAAALETSEFLKSMAHPERLIVLCRLSQGELSAGDLFESSNLSQSAFSQQLKVLKKHRLVKVRNQSQQVFYSLADHRVKAILNHLHDVFCQPNKA